VVLLCVLCVSGILLVENSQRKTKNQRKMASRAAMQWPTGLALESMDYTSTTI
jgi:hypothetical protein